MAARTSWAGGSLGGGNGAFMPAFALSDMASLPQLSSVLSTIMFDNTVATLGTPDQFMDISFDGAITPSLSTIQSGAGIGFWLAVLQENGTTIYDGRLTPPGTQVPSTTYGPLMNPLGGIPISPGTSVTNIAGSLLNVTIPPRKFGLVMQNQSGFAFTATGLTCSISTYRQNTNA